MRVGQECFLGPRPRQRPQRILRRHGVHDRVYAARALAVGIGGYGCRSLFQPGGRQFLLQQQQLIILPRPGDGALRRIVFRKLDDDLSHLAIG
jgi:hypothetical protein